MEKKRVPHDDPGLEASIQFLEAQGVDLEQLASARAATHETLPPRLPREPREGDDPGLEASLQFLEDRGVNLKQLAESRAAAQEAAQPRPSHKT